MKTFYFLLLAIISSAFYSCSSTARKSDAYGNFEATEAVVSAEGTGKLLHLTVQEGQTLTSGATVGLIDTVQLFLRKKQLVAMRQASASRVSNILSQINVLQEQRRVATVEKNRFEQLFQTNAATEKQVTDVKGALSVLERQVSSIEAQNAGVLAEVRSLEAQIAQVEDQMKKCVIVNPRTGSVLSKYAEEGELAATGKALYRIADLSRMELRVFVSGDQLPHIVLGSPVTVLIDDDKEKNKSLEGTISWISSKAEFTPKIIQTKEERVNMVYAVKIAVKNDGSLKIGMPGEVRFTAASTTK